MSRSRRYLLGLFGTVALVLVITLVTNLRVNPWRVTPARFSDASLDPWRDYSSALRTGKCGYVRYLPSIGVALIGSSRVANALDPANPHWRRQDVVNFGCGGAFIFEGEAFCRYILSKHEPELIIFGLDPGDLSSKVDTRTIGDFYSSPLGPEREAVNRELRYWFGISTFEASLETLKRKWTGRRPQYSPRGQRLRPEKPPAVPQLDFLAQLLTGGGSLGLPGLELGVESDEMNPEKVVLLESLMRDCRARGIRFVSLIHPQHALLHARQEHIGQPIVPYEGERRAILQIANRVNTLPLDGPPVEIWDFGNFHPINCEPLPDDRQSRMKNWGDLNHYEPHIGDLILARIMGWPLNNPARSDYGIRLDDANIDAWLAGAKRRYHAWLTGPGADDLAWKEEKLRQAGQP